MDTIVVDWRSEETEVVEAFAAALPASVLAWHAEGDLLFLVVHGSRVPLPLTYTPIDRYVTIASIAHALAATHETRVVTASLAGDTHELVLVPHGTPAPAGTEPLVLGVDGFSGKRVPYAT